MATIGSISSQRVAKQPFSPDMNSTPAAQLGGLSDAVLRLSDAKAQQAESLLISGEADTSRNLQLRTRQDNLDKAKAMVDFNRLQGEWTREAVEIEKNAAADGSDVDALLQEGFNKKFGGYIDGLPEHLRNDMLPAIETYKQNEYTSAYGKKLGMQGKAYIGGLQELQTTMMDSIFNGDKTAAELDPVLDEYFKNSPLPKAETEELKKAARKSLQEMEFLSRATEEIADPTTARPGSTSAGLPPVANALGAAIASKESGGDYGIRYGGANGPQKFDDFSQHPNVGETITHGPHAGEKSTAAGKYQFINGTWQYVAEAIGAEDFSPANQERGMWFLAQDDYRKRTGRDLQADLESGSSVLIGGVRKHLVGTWEGLGNMTDAEFVAMITGGAAAPSLPSVFEDASYDELSDIEKFQLMQKAQETANKQRADALAAKQAQNAALQQQMLLDIQSGKMTGPVLERTAIEQGFTYEETQKLRKAREEWQAGAVAVEGLAKALVTPGAIYGEQEQKGMEALYAQEGKAKVAERDPAYIAGTVFPLVDKTGLVPKGLAQDLMTMAKSNNPADATFAFDTMSGLFSMNPGLFGRAFSEDLASDMLFYQNTAGFLSEQERLDELKRRNSPEFKQVQSQLKQNIQNEFAANPADFQPATIASNLGFDSGLDPRTASALSSDFNTLYEREYLKTGNHQQATEATTALMSTRWAVFEIGGQTALMENPPSLVGIQPIAGSYEWLGEVVKKDFPEIAAQPYRLASDHITDADKTSGRPPSYMIETEIFPGFFAPTLGPDNLPLRINFDEPEVQQTAAVEVGIWERKAQGLFALQLEANTAMQPKGFALLPGMGGDTKTAETIAGLLSAAAETTDTMRPQYAPDRPKPANPVPALAGDELAATLRKLNYTSIEEFIDDMPMMDFDTLKMILEEN